MVSELQAETNSFVRLFQRHNRESWYIVLVAICVIAATLSWQRSERAIDETKEAKAEIVRLDDDVEQLTDSIDVYRIRLAKLDAWMKAHGVPTEEIYDD